MPTIYEVKTGKAVPVEHMIDAKEAVANGSYTFSAPAPVEEKKPEPKPEPKPKPVIKTSPKKPKFTKEIKILKKPIRK